MTRRHNLFATVALASALALPQAALAQPKPAEGITIVIPLNAIGASREASVKAMQAVQAVVRQQPNSAFLAVVDDAGIYIPVK